MFDFSRGNYGPITSTLMNLSDRKQNQKAQKGKKGLGKDQPLLGPTTVDQPLLGPTTVDQPLLGPNIEPTITAGLGAPPPAPAPTGVPMGTGFWGGNIPQSPTGPAEGTTGPVEERLINNMTTDSFRTQLLRHEGSMRAEGADSRTGAHKIYKDTTGNWTTGYGQKMTDENFAELGIDPTDETAIANAQVPDEWSRNKFAEGSTKAYQQGGAYLAELGLPATGPLGDIMGNMMYQMGDQGVRGFSKMGAALRKGDTAAAAKEMLNSKWAKQTPMRAQELAQQMQAIGQLKVGMGA